MNKLIGTLIYEIGKREADLINALMLDGKKTEAFAKGEYDKALSILEFYGRHASKTVKWKSSAHIKSVPLGNVLLITPWNFPMVMTMLKFGPAIITDNKILWKFSMKAMKTSVILDEIFRKVLNTRYRTAAGYLTDIIKEHRVNGISFTGSSEVAKYLAIQAAELNIPFTAEAGGKSAITVMPSADLDKAASGIFASAFTYGQQVCTSSSRLLVHEMIMEPLLEKLYALLDNIEPQELIDSNSVKAHIERTEKASRNESKMLWEHKDPMGPKVILQPNPKAKINQRENFSPILSVIPVKSLQGAVTINNNTEYGFVSGLYSNLSHEIDYFIDKVETGTVVINRQTTGLPLESGWIGWKSSGYGPYGEGGFDVVNFYLKKKVIHRC